MAEKVGFNTSCSRRYTSSRGPFATPFTAASRLRPEEVYLEEPGHLRRRRSRDIQIVHRLPAARRGTRASPGNTCSKSWCRSGRGRLRARSFRYRDPTSRRTTCDRHLAIRRNRRHHRRDGEATKQGRCIGARRLQRLGSMITREADGRICTHAGPEIGVASTKAFTRQHRRPVPCWRCTSVSYAARSAKLNAAAASTTSPACPT